MLLEIGGNDLVSGADIDTFEAQLVALVQAVAGDDRTVVMFELPTPPLHGGYARAQRRVAADHGVVLIPRRHFVGVIRHADATSDGVHLSPRGHVRMADFLDHWLAPSFRPSATPGFVKAEATLAVGAAP